MVIFNDPTHTEYDYWDLKLLKALAFANDFIREGVPVWWDENDDVFFEVDKRISRSKAAVERTEAAESRGDRTPPKGRYYVPVPKTRGGAPLPTFMDWANSKARKKGQN